MPPAARVGDMHTCPQIEPGPVPHVGGPILPPGGMTVLIGYQPAARMGDMLTCVGPPDTIAMGSPTVLIGNMMAARMGDPTDHGGVIILGEPTVEIGEAGSAGGGPGGGGGGGGAASVVAGVSQSGASDTPITENTTELSSSASPPSDSSASAAGSAVGAAATSGDSGSGASGSIESSPADAGTAVGQAATGSDTSSSGAGAAGSAVGSAATGSPSAPSAPAASPLSAQPEPDAGTPAGRQQTAANFYAKTGWPGARSKSHMACIDYSKPVEVVVLKKGTKVKQWVEPSYGTGNYFDADAPPENLGIYPLAAQPRELREFTLTQDTAVLKSTAAPVTVDWLPIPPQHVPGGATQLFSLPADKGNFAG